MMENPDRTRYRIALDTYNASKEQIARLHLLTRLVRNLESSGARYAVAGGYGLDGLYGALTRDHDDIDLVTTEEYLPAIQKVVRAAGFELDIVKLRGNVEVYIHAATKTKLELATLDGIKEYTDIDVAHLLPESPNAALDNTAFRTPSIVGHDELSNIQNKRAVEGDWGPYKHSEWKSRIMAELKSRVKTSD